MLANDAAVELRSYPASDTGTTSNQDSAPAASAAQVFRLLTSGARAGHRGVLATITNLTGSGARAIGAHMAVLDNGSSAGSFSSGCIERAIVAEALEVLGEGASRTMRFGQGSPYIDIRLPCGGGMDVLFLADPATSVLERTLFSLEARHPVQLRLDPAGHLAASPDLSETTTGWRDGNFVVQHVPSLRLVLIGHGAEMLTSLKLAQSFGAEVELYSPDSEILEAGPAEGVAAVRLTAADSPVNIHGDPWTAFLFLFHDHDWEPPLIRKALGTESFWVGAMGSSSTHAARCAALAQVGLAEDVIARVHGPVGVIPGSRDPATLALSALTEIVGAYRALSP